MRFLFILLVSATVAFGQAFTVNDIPFMAQTPPASSAAYIVTHLTNASSTALLTVYPTPAFTAFNNEALFVFTAQVGANIGVATASNTGTSNLTWWPAVGGLDAGLGNQKFFFISALPTGTSPFTMVGNINIAGGANGCEEHMFQVTGTDKTALWGTNAILQTANTNITAGSPIRFTLTNAATVGKISFVMMMGQGASGLAIETGWVLGASTGHSTPNMQLLTWYKTNSTAFTEIFITNNGVATVTGLYIEVK